MYYPPTPTKKHKQQTHTYCLCSVCTFFVIFAIIFIPAYYYQTEINKYNSDKCRILNIIYIDEPECFINDCKCHNDSEIYPPCALFESDLISGTCSGPGLCCMYNCDVNEVCNSRCGNSTSVTMEYHIDKLNVTLVQTEQCKFTHQSCLDFYHNIKNYTDCYYDLDKPLTHVKWDFPYRYQIYVVWTITGIGLLGAFVLFCYALFHRFINGSRNDYEILA